MLIALDRTVAEIMSSDEDSLNNNYISEEEEAPPPKKKRGKAKKDPNKPKRNMSAFFLYSNANRARIKEEQPGVAFGQVVSSALWCCRGCRRQRCIPPLFSFDSCLHRADRMR